VTVSDLDLQRLQERFGVQVPDTALLLQALTHSSYLNENPGAAPASNERLEFLGDAVLGMLAAEYLYRAFPDLPEGELTGLRAAVVRAEQLAGWARELGLGDMLLLGKGEETHRGRESKRLLASTFEALLGAIFLQLGLDGARRALEGFVPPAIESVIRRRGAVDSKSMLQQVCQASRQITPVYRVVEITGPAHRPEYTVEVVAGEERLATGTGKSKPIAEQTAAAEALIRVSETWGLTGEAEHPARGQVDTRGAETALTPSLSQRERE
jgi:ribonuclease-3